MSGPDAASDVPRLFVSHSHEDNAYCRAFVAALRQALGGDDDAVWYDEHNLGWGNIRRTIERELERRQHFIAILSPAAVESQWVNDEIDAALGLLREGQMRTVAFVTAEKCDVPRLLRGYKRVERRGGEGYAPAEAAARVRRFIQPVAMLPPPVTSSPRVEMPGKPEPALDAPAQYEPARTPVVSRAPSPERYTDALERQGTLTPAALLHERLPGRMRRLGFTAWTAKDSRAGTPTALILPPLCSVPAGSFLMGSDPRQDALALEPEMPQHEVTLPSYQIATFPVTVAEYACFIRVGHETPPRGLFGPDWQTQLTRPDHPVVGITWYGARDYVAWLAMLTGQAWALPSEAEWEKAARWDASASEGNAHHDAARIYPWGDEFDAARCNTAESRIRGATAVGSYGPEHPYRDGSSSCGAQDMAGNVWEWTRTIYDAEAYRGNAEVAPEDRDSTADRVLRGGSWRAVGRHARAAHRNSGVPSYAGAAIGFRVVMLSAAPAL